MVNREDNGMVDRILKVKYVSRNDNNSHQQVVGIVVVIISVVECTVERRTLIVIAVVAEDIYRVIVEVPGVAVMGGVLPKISEGIGAQVGGKIIRRNMDIRVMECPRIGDRKDSEANRVRGVSRFFPPRDTCPGHAMDGGVDPCGR